jgi:hypothetical protein
MWEVRARRSIPGDVPFAESSGLSTTVTPANPGSGSGAGAGVQCRLERAVESRLRRDWIPAFAGMTVAAPMYETGLRDKST